MPNNYDFSRIKDVKDIEVNPDGWVNPLLVEYGISIHGEIESYYWRVKGTKHTFVIPIIRMDYLNQGNVKEHFEEALEGFREDYKGWANEGWYAPWMRAYREDFSKFISL